VFNTILVLTSFGSLGMKRAAARQGRKINGGYDSAAIGPVIFLNRLRDVDF
jgi:hypothetical protein